MAKTAFFILLAQCRWGLFNLHLHTYCSCNRPKLCIPKVGHRGGTTRLLLMDKIRKQCIQWGKNMPLPWYLNKWTKRFKFRWILLNIQEANEWSAPPINPFKIISDYFGHNSTTIIIYKQGYKILNIGNETLFTIVVSCFGTSLKTEAPFRVNITSLQKNEMCNSLYTTNIWKDWISLWLIFLYQQCNNAGYQLVPLCCTWRLPKKSTTIVGLWYMTRTKVDTHPSTWWQRWLLLIPPSFILHPFLRYTPCHLI